MARMRMALRPVNRTKHVVDGSATLASGTNHITALIQSADATALANVNQVLTASKIFGIYLKVEVASNEDTVVGGIPNVYCIVYKNPGNNLTTPDVTQIGADDNKRFVIHQEMIMIENKGGGGNPRILFNGVIKIPKGFQRFGPQDRLYLVIKCPVIDIALCFQCHYKEFR